MTMYLLAVYTEKITYICVSSTNYRAKSQRKFR